MEQRIGTWDIVALVLYFVAVLSTGLASMCRSNRGTVSGYFLAGRFMIWLPVGASLFASNIGSEHFIGLAGSGAATGIGVAAFEFNASILLQLLGWVFLPVYIASGVCTLPEYMQKRFGGTRIQIYLSVFSLSLYVLTKISVNLYSGSLFIREALGWNIWWSVLLLLTMTAIITIGGGLAAVIYTDTLQCFVMLLGALALSIMSFVKVGGFEGLYKNYGSSISQTNATRELFRGGAEGNGSAIFDCALPSEKAFIMLRSVDDKDMPWLGFLLGQTPASIWYWCADQMMVQRALAAKSLSHAQGATIMAGFIKLLPLFIMVMPGMISRVLYPNEIACATAEDCLRVCGQRSGCTNLAYPKLVMGLMPDGLRGVMLAVMLAALITDLTSIFNSASTLFTVDIYRRFRGKPTNRELMVIGRLFVIVMVIVSILWIPVIQEMQGGQLYIYIQSVAAYLSPPIAAVYLIAILWKRGNERGAFTGLMYGFIIGAIRLIFDFVWREPLCGDVDNRPWLLREVHYMYFALFSFVTTGVVVVAVSFTAKAPTMERLEKMTYWTRGQREGADPLGEEGRFTNGDGTALEMLPKKDENVVDIVFSKDQPVGCRGRLLRAANWFCGFEEAEQTILDQAEQTRHLRKITNLKQDPRARILLSVAMAVLICVTIFCFCFFSLYFGLISVGLQAVNQTVVTVRDL